MDLHDLFIEKLTISDHFIAVKIKQKLFWENETVPLTCALGDFGHYIATNYYEFNELEREYIFAVIEEGMSSNDCDLRNAVATGLIEAMDSAACDDPEKWLNIKKSLGSKSNIYLDGWLKHWEINWNQTSLIVKGARQLSGFFKKLF